MVWTQTHVKRKVWEKEAVRRLCESQQQELSPFTEAQSPGKQSGTTPHQRWHILVPTAQPILVAESKEEAARLLSSLPGIVRKGVAARTG